MPPWKEIYRGGSPEAEQALFRAMAREMMKVRRANSERAGADHRLRMIYAKTVVGVTNASLVMDRILPAELAVGHFHPGTAFPAAIRLSNASGIPQADGAPDMRGLAIRLALPRGARHDLLLGNFPTSLARDAEQFFEFSMMALGDRELLLARLAARLGVQESRRIAAYLKASLKLCTSLASEHFWSGSPYLWGRRPVRFELRPVGPRDPIRDTLPSGDDALRLELAARLTVDDVRYRLAVQCYADEASTPIEDAAVDWRQRAAPSIEIATLIIPRQDILGPEGTAAQRKLEGFAFNPWNAPAGFRPLGSLNRMRRLAYEMGAHGRSSGNGSR